MPQVGFGSGVDRGTVGVGELATAEALLAWVVVEGSAAADHVAEPVAEGADVGPAELPWVACVNRALSATSPKFQPSP